MPGYLGMTRLQKLLAEAGFGSRRKVEAWIRAGRVTVGGRRAKLGDRAGPGDDIRLDGRTLALAAAAGPAAEALPELLLYYKPLGEVTTRRDPEGRPTVFERLPPPKRGRWVSIGRLDVNTTGLLLLTTDGGLAHRLMHPSGEVEREYLVHVRGKPGPEAIGRLLMGVMLEDGPASFDSIVAEEAGAARGSQRAFRVVLREGRNREVRRLWKAAGFEVSRLLRMRYGPVQLPRDLKPGTSRRAGRELIERLRAAASETAPATGRPRVRRASK